MTFFDKREDQEMKQALSQRAMANSGGGQPSVASKKTTAGRTTVQVTVQLQVNPSELALLPVRLSCLAERLRSVASELDALTQVQWSVGDMEIGGAIPSTTTESQEPQSTSKPARPPVRSKHKADAGPQ